MLCVTVAGSHAVQAGPLLLFEPATGRVLYADEPDRAWHPASVTKLMTAYLTFEAVQAGRLAWDDDVPLSEHARGQPATRIGLRGGIKLNVEQAVRGLILRSANDFAVALAERVSGTEAAFVETMNATARRLGMTRTVYRNPHGLPDQEQVTTARDLAILTTALLKDFPDRAEVFSTPTVRIHKGTFHSQNDLLRTLPGADGMKTGFTCASGYNIVASATREGRRLIAVILGAVNRQSRSERATEVLEAGFAYLAGETQMVTVPAAKPIKVRGKPAPEETPAEMPPFAPVGLRELALAPADPVQPDDIARQVRSGKCRGYGGFSKPEPEPAVSEADTDAENPAEVTPVVTGSVAATPPAALPAPQKHAKKPTEVLAKPATAQATLTAAPKPAKAPARIGSGAPEMKARTSAPAVATSRKRRAPLSRPVRQRGGPRTAPDRAVERAAAPPSAPADSSRESSLGAGFVD